MENEKNAEKVRSPSDIKLLLTYPAPLYNESYEFKKLRKEMFILMLVGLLLCIIFGPGLLTVIM
ncbi:MAG: hypothetical protein LUD03_07010, partial [Firmicutes bacterium]|nr:hypothetical protein [Bacillota bacterium]